MISFIIWDVDPKIFQDFDFLRWYGVSWVLGMMVGYIIMRYVYKSEGVSLIELDKVTIYVIVGGILGARLGHILFYDPIYYWENPIEILPVKINPTFEFTGLAGLASHGGILGALLALYLYNRKFSKGYLWLLDRLTIAGAAWINVSNSGRDNIIYFSGRKVPHIVFSKSYAFKVHNSGGQYRFIKSIRNQICCRIE
jgi:prolipoprotein diacylglyceryltransferase